MKEKKMSRASGRTIPKKRKKKRTATAVNSTRTQAEKKMSAKEKKIARDETTDTQRAPTAAHTNLGNNQFTILTWG